MVYFGKIPAWFNLTAVSMQYNRGITFVLTTDIALQGRWIPDNLHIKFVTFKGFQQKLAQLANTTLTYNDPYKMNDAKPLLFHMYPEYETLHYWSAWADVDVIFGNLSKYIQIAEKTPACCKTAVHQNSGLPLRISRVNVFYHEQVCPCASLDVRANVVCPLFPNPWRKMVWGPFTAFRNPLARDLFRNSPQWRQMITTPAYAHLDEWWGPFAARGWHTMGDVVARLAYGTEAIRMSKTRIPFGEAKTCTDPHCGWCPCGMTNITWRQGSLLSGQQEMMLIHLAESKPAWNGWGLSTSMSIPGHHFHFRIGSDPYCETLKCERKFVSGRAIGKGVRRISYNLIKEA